MNNQKKKTTIFITITIIAILSILLNIILISSRITSHSQDDINTNQIIDNNETVVENEKDGEKEENEEKVEQKKEYIYKYIDGKEKQVIVEKEVEKTIEVPASPTDAIVTYTDAEGSTKIINLPSGTTVNFSAGEHGTYNTTPAPITLTDNQELDITSSSYNPSKVEVNYIFKGFSYSGNVFECEYSLANNTVNVECKQVENTIKKNNVFYAQLEYLESTGTQYINTGLTFNRSQPKVEMKIKDLSVKGNLFGTYRGVNDWRYGWGLFDNLGVATVEYLYIHYNSNDPVPVSDLRNGVIVMDRNKLYYNGTLVHTQGSVDSYNCNNSLFLLSGNFGSSSQRAEIPTTKLEYAKVWIDDELKLDLIPVERISDGVVGMLNLVDNSFLTNAGTGVFKQSNTVNIPGINAGRIMATGSYESSSSLELTAIANDGYTFVKWSDGNTSATRTITIGDNTVYTALFVHN